LLDPQEQLGRLKERIALINARFSSFSTQPRRSENLLPHLQSPRSFIEEWSTGQIVSNEFGPHFQTERLFPSHRPHGSADVGALAYLAHDLLDVLGPGEIRPVAPERWAFLDTETTGLMSTGGSAYAFLIGVGRITREGFRVRQFFMRHYTEECSTLAALEAHLNEFDVLITYNGKTYDQPLLETRYTLGRQPHPFLRLQHLDLLYGARRLWKLRGESCRLIQLEREILGYYRDGDLPGDLIPYVYFEYLRSHEARRLVPIFHHNAMDILTLACLTAIVPTAFRATDFQALAQIGVKRGEDLAGIARWLLATDQPEQALGLLKRSIDTGLPDALLFRALWDVALIEKKLGCHAASVRVFTELVSCTNPFRFRALEELAKHYEHEENDFALALEFTNKALAARPSSSLLHRRTRLEKRLAKPKARRAKSSHPLKH